MVIKRNPDGIPVEEPSIIQSNKMNPVDDLPTSVTTGDPKKRGGISIDINKPTIGGRKASQDTPTVNTDSKQTSSSQSLMFEPEPETQVLSKKTQASVSDNASAALDEPETSIARPELNKGLTDRSNEEAMSDPTSGWLVIVAGPGKGNYLKLGYGQNSIGRDASQRVALNYGDSQISRTNHAIVTYDPRGNQFYIQPGSGTNLTYISGQPTPVMQPQVLASYSHISLGDTTLRFIPLCGELFTWDEADKE